MNAPFSHMAPDAPQVVLFTPGMRRLIADAIESLILLLDEIDGDAEIEEDGSDEEPRFVPAFEAIFAVQTVMAKRHFLPKHDFAPPAKARGAFCDYDRARLLRVKVAPT